MLKITSKSKVFLLISGLISVILGIIIIANPGITMITLAVVLGAGLLATGITHTISYFAAKKVAAPHSNWLLLLAILDIFIGIFLLANIGTTIVAIPFVIGFWAMFSSISRIAAAVNFKELGFHNWWIVLVSGLLGLLLAMLIMTLPVFGMFVISVYIGIFFVWAGFMSLAEVYFMAKLD